MRDLSNNLLGTFPYRSVKIGGLGYVTGMAFASDGTGMIAGTDVGGAYRRYSGDAQWTQMFSTTSIPSGILNAAAAAGGGSNGCWALDIAPSDKTVIYVGFKDRLLRSDDSGDTFVDTSINSGSVYMNANGGNQRLRQGKLKVDPTNSEVVYCGTQRDGLFRYMSGSWTNIATVPASDSASDDNKYILIAIDPTSSLTGAGATSRRSVVYASSEGQGLYKSTDGGTTFAIVTGHPGAGASYSFRFLTIDTNGYLYLGLITGANNNVWKSVDGGANWTNLTFSGGEIAWLCPDPKDSTRLVGKDTNGSPLITLNSGTSFTGVWNPGGLQAVATSAPIVASVLNAGFAAPAGMSSAAFFPHPTLDRDYIAMGYGVCYFNDPWPVTTSGTTLQIIEDTAGIEELVSTSAMITPNGDTLVCSMDKAIIRIADPATFPEQSYPVTTLTNGFNVDWAIDDPNWLVCLVHKNGNHSGYSADGGRNWTAFPVSYSDTIGGGSIAVSNKNQIVVFPGQNSRPRYSHDYGATWTYCTFTGLTHPADGVESGWGFGLTETRRFIVTADKDTPGTFYAYNYGYAANVAGSRGIWKSTDGGINWTRVNSTSIINSLAAGYHVVLKCIEGDLYLTTGITGSRYTADTPTNAGFYKSIDGGVNWTQIANMAEVTFAFGKAPYGGTYPSLYMIGYYNGTWGLHVSYDGGATVSTLSLMGSFDEIWALQADPTKFGRILIGYTGTAWFERRYYYNMRLT